MSAEETAGERPAPVDLFDAIGLPTPEQARRLVVLLGLNKPRQQDRDNDAA